LSKVCQNVSIELPLPPLSEGQLYYRSANVEDDAHLDVSAESFYVSAESFWGQEGGLF